MQELLNSPYGVFALCVGALILLLHLPTALMRGGVARALAYVNLLLHPIMMMLLLFAGAELELCALAFMISLAVYSLLCLLRYELGSGSVDGDEATDEEGGESL